MVVSFHSNLFFELFCRFKFVPIFRFFEDIFTEFSSISIGQCSRALRVRWAVVKKKRESVPLSESLQIRVVALFCEDAYVLFYTRGDHERVKYPRLPAEFPVSCKDI